MCCFSGKVDVSSTRIFARFVGQQSQALVYQMKYRAKDPVAMVLPIPTPAGTKEDAVKFISLQKYKNFFADLNSGFIQPGQDDADAQAPRGLSLGVKPLKVEEVGDFIASFVPSVADFTRLDERFRLPASAWEKLPDQKKYGFAVFQLKAAVSETHPMAFTFPTAADAKLFFPTVHIHDGEVHAEAEFDHILYLQPRRSDEVLPRHWEESTQPAGMFANEKEAQGLLNGKLHLYRRTLVGKLKNMDTLV